MAATTITGQGFTPGTTVTITLGRRGARGPPSWPPTAPSRPPSPPPPPAATTPSSVTDGVTTVSSTLAVACTTAAAPVTSGALPYTGSSSSIPLAQIGLGLIAAGGIVVLTMRKRRIRPRQGRRLTLTTAAIVTKSQRQIPAPRSTGTRLGPLTCRGMTPRHVAFRGRLISRRWSRWVASILALALLAAACSSSQDHRHRPHAPPQLRVVPLSGARQVRHRRRPARRHRLPRRAVARPGQGHRRRHATSPTGSASTRSQRPPGAPVRLVGLVDGLPEGTSTITAEADGAKASVEVDNHPIDGPLFSGPHQSPFVCTTAANDLGAPGDNCWAQTKVSWKYVDTAGNVNDLADPAKVPDNVATTTVGTRTVPVRHPRRARRVQPLHRHLRRARPPPRHPARLRHRQQHRHRRRRRPRQLHRRAHLGPLRAGTAGSSCASAAAAAPPTARARTTSTPSTPTCSPRATPWSPRSLTNFATACNSVLSAETAEVLKEHFSETYGLPRVTIGEGGSGGAIQQLQIAQNYPGILDAIAPSMPFPDAISIAGGVTDCGLLLDYFNGAGSWLEPGPAERHRRLRLHPHLRRLEAQLPQPREPQRRLRRQASPTRCSTPPPSPAACAAPCRTPTSTSSASTPPPATPSAPSTTSASSTGSTP